MILALKREESFQPGDTVEICGTKLTNLNGKQGEVTDTYKTQHGKYAVLVIPMDNIDTPLVLDIPTKFLRKVT